MRQFEPQGAPRPVIRGKFLERGGAKLWLRGVTYGTFRQNGDGEEYGSAAEVEADFKAMTAFGINAIRTYTVPPRRLLDAAADHGLAVLVGIPWEQHVPFLDDRTRARSIEARVRAAARSCAGHVAVLGYAVGNEIPAGIVRWHGARAVERFLARLCDAVRDEDPGCLATYVNFPSTEYLDLHFVDLVCFNVFLESRIGLEGYLARLQNLAGERPLLVAELGLDSLRNGEDVQAAVVSSQVGVAFAAGCAGAFVFSWTDDWHRGGHDVEEWRFGLVDRWRRPKPALAATAASFAAVPFPPRPDWPAVTVAVCTFNGAESLARCLGGIRELDYLRFEVVVVDDGSTDGSAAIAEEFGARVVRTTNGGLASARNVALAEARGEIVAFTDDDAYPDIHWLRFLVQGFSSPDVGAVGGPNLPPEGDGAVAECVARTPGGPTHVLISDREAEHIPGCNMAVRKAALEEIGGFDPQFRIAGDDVDICWRLQDYGWKLGFSAAAVVWHHRRPSLRRFWRQQREYGRAEALLERKWPEKYNLAGHVSWSGRLYGATPRLRLPWRGPRIRYGIWGTGAYQQRVEPGPPAWHGLVGSPEWFLVVVLLGALAGLGALWRPMTYALPAAAAAAGLVLVRAAIATATSAPPRERYPRTHRVGLYVLTFGLHVAQPLARLSGRLRYGLTPWRRRGTRELAVPRPRSGWFWSETWRAPEDWLQAASRALKREGAVVRHGDVEDRWDLEISGGPLGAARMRSVVEEHGHGRQLVRFGLRPRVSLLTVLAVAAFGALAAGAALDGAAEGAAALAALAAAVVLVAVKDCATATAAGLRLLRDGLPDDLPPVEIDLAARANGDSRAGRFSLAEADQREVEA